MHAAEDFRVCERLDRALDHESEREAVVAVEHCTIALVRLPDTTLELSSVNELIPNRVYGLDPTSSGVGLQLVELELVELPTQEAGVAVFIEHIVVPILRDVLLKKAETITVDGPHKHGPESVEEGTSSNLGHAQGNALLQLGSGAFGEGESDNRRWLTALVDQGGDPARDRFRFARAGAGDELQVAAAILDCSALLRRELDHSLWLRARQCRCIPTLGHSVQTPARSATMREAGTVE